MKIDCDFFVYVWIFPALKIFSKKENYVINCSPSCRFKPLKPSFIFETQIKIFLDEILELFDPQ